jgi:hypothetical protein
MPSKPLVLPNEFILLTALLCLVSILNNNDGNIWMPNSTEIKKTRLTAHTDVEESKFDTLDSMSAVLAWDREVVSSSYHDGLRYNVIVLADMPNSEGACADSNYFRVRIAKEGKSIWPTIQEGGAFHSWK